MPIVALLSDEEISAFLNKLVVAPKLDEHYIDQLRRRDLSGVSKAPTYAAVLRRIRNSLNEANASVSAIVDLFWRIGSLDIVTLAVLDEWLHQSLQTAGLPESLIRRAPQALALTRPGFALHLSVESARLDDELGVRIESALVSGAMPRQWSGTPGETPPVFLEAIEQAESLDRAWGPSGSVLFRRIAFELRRRGTEHVAAG